MDRSRGGLRPPVVLAAAGLVIRFAALLHTWETPGDGPVRATMAYDWSLAPFFVTHGVWLPAFLYLSGAFAWLVPNPLVSVRILNLVLGSLTVPLFYELVRRVYGAWPALFGASLLVILPLHIGLSATSLTEATFVLLLVSGMLLFIDGTKDLGRQHRLIAGVVLLSVAAAVRYEAWVLLPAFPLYYLLSTRRLLSSACIGIALGSFPLAWTVSNHLNEGQALRGFAAAVRGTEIPSAPITFYEALSSLGKGTLVQMGFLLPILALVGLGIQIARWRRRGLSREQLLYMSLVALHSLSMIAFAMARGNIWPRYLILGLVLSLPFAALPLEFLATRRMHVPIVAAVVVVAVLTAPSVIFAPKVNRPFVYITTRRPREIEELVKWLRRSQYRDGALLLTKMNWESTYLRLYAPEIGSRAFRYSFWRSDEDLRRFCRDRKPDLLITSSEDLKYQRHLEPLLPRPIREARVVYASGPILVYDIRR